MLEGRMEPMEEMFFGSVDNGDVSGMAGAIDLGGVVPVGEWRQVEEALESLRLAHPFDVWVVHGTY